MTCYRGGRRSNPRIEEPQPIETEALALKVADLIDERQGEDITILDVSGPLAIADYFVIATARNYRHAKGLAREIVQTLKAMGHNRRNAAGLEGENSWILIDLDEIVVHLFQAEARRFYGLESLWSDGPRVPFTPRDRPAPATDPYSPTAGSFPDPGGPDSMGGLGPPM